MDPQDYEDYMPDEGMAQDGQWFPYGGQYVQNWGCPPMRPWPQLQAPGQIMTLASQLQELTPPLSPSEQLWIRQQPEKARVIVKGREKEKKPIDPPPVLQLNIVGDPGFLHNPYLVCFCKLWHAENDEPAANPSSSASEGEQLLVGQAASSLHRLKDLDNSEKGFFVFGDLAVNVTGKFRLKFELWEYGLNDIAYNKKDTLSAVFEVASAKEWDGVKESTALSRCIADQGIKLRLRKESRHPKGMPQPAAGPSTVTTPLRPAGSYGPSDAIAGASEPSAKRQRSFGAEGSGSGPSSIASTPYAQYHPGANGAYAQYPATSSGHMHPGYYSQQYPSAYGGGYQYPYAQQQPQQQQYAMSSSAQYRPSAQTDGNSPTYPPPSTYSGGGYPYYSGSSYATSANPYPTQAGQAPPPQQQPQGQSQQGQQFSGRGAMADPSNPPQLAPINQGGQPGPSQAYKQEPDQTRGGFPYRGQ